ncbi:hypothetical protein THRCLA_09188 [Thraustotheca clavata]|uniref:Serine aminopeptidase S33 domain-containing protein n=1 Tax=Thraustotheca clavata TaxID=74557 RepID=A0A1V9YYF4_9STRA|nr:hypothetical protein THRCLA_09188 [Thraustotheca clavata]
MLWESPLVNSIAFHPRHAIKDTQLPTNAIDGFFHNGDVSLGYRFFRPSLPDQYDAVIVLFHGNAEIAMDYASAASVMEKMEIPTALLAVDFRGYGWSTGEASVAKLLDDAEAVDKQLDSVPFLKGNVPKILFGRSIGSLCAMHLAAKAPQTFRGLIVESGFHSILKLPMVQQIIMFMPGGAAMEQMMPEIFHILDKLKTVTIPFLVIHGENDDLAPVEQARDVFNACASSTKKLEIFPNAGHNDLTLRHHQSYYASVLWLLQQATKSVIDRDIDNAYRMKQFDEVIHFGKQALREGQLPEADQLVILMYLAKAAWAIYEVESVIKYTSQLLEKAPNNINAICLRAKAYLKLNESALAHADAVTLSKIIAGASENQEASIAMALLAIHFCSLANFSFKGTSPLLQEYIAYCRKKTSEPIADASSIFEKQSIALDIDNLDPEELRVLFDFIAKTTSFHHVRINLGRMPMKRALRSKLLRIGIEQPYAMLPDGYTHGLKAVQTLQSIDLTESKLGNSGLDIIEDALALQPHLLHLNLTNCLLNDASARAISRILRVQCQRRDEVYWSSTLRGQIIPVQGEGCMLLNLSKNKLGDATTEILCQALYNDNWLYGLNLNENDIGPRGVLNLAEALQTNSTLTVLLLEDNTNSDARVATFIQRMLIDRQERNSTSMNHPMEHPLLRSVLKAWKCLPNSMPPASIQKRSKTSPPKVTPAAAPKRLEKALPNRKIVTSVYAGTNPKKKGVQTSKKSSSAKAKKVEPISPPKPPRQEFSALDFLSSNPMSNSNQETTKDNEIPIVEKLLRKIESLEAAQANAQAHIDHIEVNEMHLTCILSFLEAENQELKRHIAHTPKPRKESSVDASIISELEAAIVRLTQQVQFLEQQRQTEPPLKYEATSSIPDELVDDLTSQLKQSFGLMP